MTVRQTIAVARERHITVRDPVAAALLSPAVRIAERLVEHDVDELIELMNLRAFADKFVGELSTGTRRVVDLACSLAHEPTVLLLDEPSSGIAQRETEALGPLLLDIRDRTGTALVVVEHDMPLVQSISDELVALELGAVIARGRPEVVINDPAVIEGYLGGSVAAIERSSRPTRKAATKKAATKKVVPRKRAAPPKKAAPRRKAAAR
jgi:branched-chain amino acid transport system ATP-binding protein